MFAIRASDECSGPVPVGLHTAGSSLTVCGTRAPAGGRVGKGDSSACVTTCDSEAKVFQRPAAQPKVPAQSFMHLGRAFAAIERMPGYCHCEVGPGQAHSELNRDDKDAHCSTLGVSNTRPPQTANAFRNQLPDITFAQLLQLHCCK